MEPTSSSRRYRTTSSYALVTSSRSATGISGICSPSNRIIPDTNAARVLLHSTDNLLQLVGQQLDQLNRVPRAAVVRLRGNETTHREELGELQAVDRVHERQSVVVHRTLLLDELTRSQPRRNRVGTTRRTWVEHRATASTVDRASLRLEQHLAATTRTRSDLHLRGTDLGGRDTRAA